MAEDGCGAVGKEIRQRPELGRPGGGQRLRDRASTKPIGFELLPTKFTMRSLQNLYEAIWNLKIDKRNFINKINALGIVEKLNEKDKESSRKGSFLYQFNADSFDKSNGKQFILKF